jgi:hypothetical protein
MPSRNYYILEARRLFDMALMARDPVVRGRWIERANEYLVLADSLPDNQPLADELPPAAPQPQPMQQQQSKAEDE